MSLPNMTATMVFEQGDYSWTEKLTYLGNEFSTLQDLLNHCSSVNGLGWYRSALMGGGVSLVGIKVSWDSIWRDVLKNTIQGEPIFSSVVAPQKAAADFPADNAYSCTVFNLQLGGAYSRNYYMSGLPAACQLPANPGQFPTQYQNALSSYMAYLCGQVGQPQRWGSIVRSKSTALDPTPNIDVTINPPAYAVVAGQGMLTLNIVGGAPSVPKGGQVRILGVTGPKGSNTRAWNGVFTAATAAAGTVLVLQTKTSPAAMPTLNFGSAFVWAITEEAEFFTDWAWSKITHRKRGNSSVGPRGRSRTR